MLDYMSFNVGNNYLPLKYKTSLLKIRISGIRKNRISRLGALEFNATICTERRLGKDI